MNPTRLFRSANALRDYRAAVLETGPVWYSRVGGGPFLTDEVSATIGNHSAEVVVGERGPVPGPSSSAARYQTAASSSVPGYFPMVGSAPHTIAVWVRYQQGDLATHGGLVSSGLNQYLRRWFFVINAGGALAVDYWNGGALGTQIIGNGQWRLVGVSYAGGAVSGIQLWVDGVVEPKSFAYGAQGAFLNLASAGTPLTLGAASGVIGLPGLMAEAAIWPRVLTAAEWRSIYLMGKNGRTS